MVGKTTQSKSFSLRSFPVGKTLMICWTLIGVGLWFTMMNMLGVENPEPTLIIILPAQLGILLGLPLFPTSIGYILYRGYRFLRGLKKDVQV